MPKHKVQADGREVSAVNFVNTSFLLNLRKSRIKKRLVNLPLSPHSLLLETAAELFRRLHLLEKMHARSKRAKMNQSQKVQNQIKVGLILRESGMSTALCAKMVGT